MAEKICLTTTLSLGDIVVLTAAVESIVKQFPGKYELYVQTSCDSVWENNPHVKIIKVGQPIPEGIRVVKAEYPSVHVSNQRAVHFINGYVNGLAKALNIPLEIQVNRPYIYLSKEEQSWMSMVHEHFTNNDTKYWLMSAGIKSDYTIKWYPYYQEIVDRFKGRIQFVQIGEKSHTHPPLTDVINLIGQTDVRMLIRLVSKCQGGIGPITALNHLCAAFGKPYVCIGGGREPANWMQNYNSTILLHNGYFMSCGKGGCWKSRVVLLKDGDEKDKNLCANPMFGGAMPYAKCMGLITPEEISLSIERILNSTMA